MRPFLKWAGNKYRLLDKIKPLLPPGKRLVEPFLGSGAVFVNTEYPAYLLGELSVDLVNLYHYVSTEGPKFSRYAKKHFVPENNVKQAYLDLRTEFNQTTRQRQRAALFLYLLRHGFNGLCRFNGSGKFNVPFGALDKPYFPEQELQYFHDKAQLATFVQQDFTKTLAAAKAGDVIYCDPPYVPLSKTASFTCYSGKVFSEDDQLTLADMAIDLAKRGITVIISNHDTEFTREAYRTAKLIQFEAPRFISSKTQARRPAKELLAVFKGK